jgi:broad specificity phosphatase PhoE
MTNLLLIRHAMPAWGSHAPPSKWVLTEQGREKSRVLGAYLKERRVGRIIASTEAKAVETAEIAAKMADVSQVTQDHDLREHDRDNTPTPAGADRQSLVIECIRNPNELIWGSETVSAARDRFSSAVNRLLDNAQDDETVAIVSHGTVITTFVGEKLGIDPVPIWESMGTPWLIEIEWPNPTEILDQRLFD